LAGERRIRVLIAEDDADVRGALADLVAGEATLELVGTAGDADEALAVAEREHPDVAVVDVRMPGGGGAHVARRIKEVAPGANVIALTAHDDRATVLEMLEAGVVGYLVKGGSVEELLASIDRAVSGRASLSAEVAGEVMDELSAHLQERAREEEARRESRRRIEQAVGDDVVEIVFQPLIELRSRAVVGAEALARFHADPPRPPDVWFAEAVAVDLGPELELTAIRRAIALLPKLPADVYLAVNGSPAVFSSMEFGDLITSKMARRLVMEVTEHARISDYEALTSALAPVRARGVRLAIDDAGAGFASLQHILRLGPEFIKLDMGLIRGIHRDRSQQALAAGLISFAEKIGATIVAEGIEVEDELEALYALGVEYGQGYLFARPGPLPLAQPAQIRTG
jgi:EAL domain-containing protein (putative c-di-GMP-specific phosphodiesterase class I)/DNA-binding NarL/FixJ family response regulator